MIGRMRRPPSKLVERLVSVSEEVLRPDPALRLEDIAALIGSARATLYYHFSGRDDLVAFLLEEHRASRPRQSSSPSHPPGPQPSSYGQR